MPDRYCRQCGVELEDDTSYCPECGAATSNDHKTIDKKTPTTNNSWKWMDPRGPFRSPRRVLGTLNIIGFVSFLVAIGLNAVGLPITVLPHPLDIALFIFWLGVIIVGIPLWGFLHILNNIL